MQAGLVTSWSKIWVRASSAWWEGLNGRGTNLLVRSPDGSRLATTCHRWCLLSTASELGVSPRFRPAGFKRARRWQPRGGGDVLHAGFSRRETVGRQSLSDGARSETIRHWGSDDQGPKTVHVTRHGPGTTKHFQSARPPGCAGQLFCCFACCS